MPAAQPAARERRRGDVGGLRRVHLGMIDAVLAGEGVARVAALAAAELGGSVAIVLPALERAVAEPRLGVGALAAVERYVGERLHGRPATVPPDVVAEVDVRSGDERLGVVALLGAGEAAHAREILELAALAATTAVTLRDSSLTQRRASAALLDDLRDLPPLSAAEIVARARRLGADLRTGASALCVRPAAGSVDRVLAAIAQERPGALAAVRGDRVEALVPGAAGETAAAVRRLAARLSRSAPIGIAPFEPDPAQLRRALRAAELALALGEHERLEPSQPLSGSWRLLIGAAAGDPPALAALIDSTVGPARGSGREPLLETLRAYLDHGANMNATAGAVYAHRHTISQRLERLRALTGHDPQTPHGQAQLALGLQALAVQRALARIDDSGTAVRLRAV